MEGFFKGNDKIDWCKDVPFLHCRTSFLLQIDHGGSKKLIMIFTPTMHMLAAVKNMHTRYPYRYSNGLTGDYLINEHFDKVDFKMVIFGPVVNPLVIIGGHSTRSISF